MVTSFNDAREHARETETKGQVREMAKWRDTKFDTPVKDIALYHMLYRACKDFFKCSTKVVAEATRNWLIEQTFEDMDTYARLTYSDFCTLQEIICLFDRYANAYDESEADKIWDEINDYFNNVI